MIVLGFAIGFVISTILCYLYLNGLYNKRIKEVINHAFYEPERKIEIIVEIKKLFEKIYNDNNDYEKAKEEAEYWLELINNYNLQYMNEKQEKKGKRWKKQI